MESLYSPLYYKMKEDNTTSCDSSTKSLGRQRNITKRRLLRLVIASVTVASAFRDLSTLEDIKPKQSDCQPDTGNVPTLTTNASIFPHPPHFTSLSEIFPRYKHSQSMKYSCWYNAPMHHPHFLQQLLRCFSLWESQPSDNPRILYVPKRQFWRKIGNTAIFDRDFPISSAILKTLTTSYNVTVTNSWSDSTPLKVQRMTEVDEFVSPFAMASQEDASRWKDQFRLPREEEPITRRTKKRLKIVIVNRPFGRKLLNAWDARESIATAFPGHDVFLHQMNDASNATLYEMLEFFPTVDILVSPHGSQLTGIMFMQRCSAVLEIFPHLVREDCASRSPSLSLFYLLIIYVRSFQIVAKYWTPWYFSSLARIFQLPHANWYVSNQTEPQHMHDLQTRMKNSGNSMCLSTKILASAVDELIRKRQNCLDSMI